jgi:hypothetical protein
MPPRKSAAAKVETAAAPSTELAKLTVPMPDAQLSERAQALLEAARLRTITTSEQYEAAAAELIVIKKKFTEIETERMSLRKPLAFVMDRLQAIYKPPLTFLEEAERIVKRKMSDWQVEQDRLRRIEQAKADEAARKEQEKIRAQAAKAEAAGKVEKAEALQQRAQAVVAPVIQYSVPQVAGIGTRENWYAECTDLMVLVKAIAEGKAPLSLVMANDKVLGQQARSLKKDFVAPGVRVWSDKNIAAGAA